jgi:hypothetical protein
MIHNDQELEAMQERMAYFYRLLSQLRVTARPEEFPLSPAAIAPRSRGCRKKCWLTSRATHANRRPPRLLKLPGSFVTLKLQHTTRELITTVI